MKLLKIREGLLIQMQIDQKYKYEMGVREKNVCVPQTGVNPPVMILKSFKETVQLSRNARCKLFE